MEWDRTVKDPARDVAWAHVAAAVVVAEAQDPAGPVREAVVDSTLRVPRDGCVWQAAGNPQRRGPDVADAERKDADRDAMQTRGRRTNVKGDEHALG